MKYGYNQDSKIGYNQVSESSYKQESKLGFLGDLPERLGFKRPFRFTSLIAWWDWKTPNIYWINFTANSAGIRIHIKGLSF